MKCETKKMQKRRWAGVTSAKEKPGAVNVVVYKQLECIEKGKLAR